MPLHFHGVDETALKTLAKRYRKILAAKKDNQSVPSLMQIQEDLVRALGHKDMHAAQAFWAALEDNESSFDERGAMKKHLQSVDIKRFTVYEAPWRAATAAMTKSPEAFAEWVKSNTATLIEMRHVHKYFDLLAYAVMEGYNESSALLETLGDSLNLERIANAMGWVEKRSVFDGSYKNKSNAKPSEAAMLRLFTRLDPQKSREAFCRLADRKQRFPGISDAIMTDLFVRSPKVMPPTHAAYFMELIETAVVSEIASGNTSIVAPWKELLASSRTWQIWTVMGSRLSANNYIGHLLCTGNVDQLREHEALIGTQSCIEEAVTMHASLWERGEKTKEDYFDNRLHLAALSGKQAILDHVLIHSEHTAKGLNNATGAACAENNEEIFLSLISMGGQVKENVESLIRRVLARMPTHSTEEVVKILERIFNGAGINASATWRYRGGVAHMMIDDRLPEKCFSKCRDVLAMLIKDYGLDINASTPEEGTPLDRALFYRPEESVVPSISLLLSLGADPSNSKKDATSPIASLIGFKGDEAKVLIEKLATHPGIWENKGGRRPMSDAYNIEQAQKMLSLGSDLRPADVKEWLVRSVSDVHFNHRQEPGPVEMVLPMVIWAMDRGIRVDEILADGSTLFHVAASTGRLMKIAAAMIARGADPQAKNGNGNTVLEFAGGAAAVDLNTLLAARHLFTKDDDSRRPVKPR